MYVILTAVQGQLCTVGTLPNLSRLFYYVAAKTLLLEIIDRRNRDLKHLVQLVTAEGEPIAIPPGARFVHVRSEECLNLLEHHLKAEQQSSRLPQ